MIFKNLSILIDLAKLVGFRPMAGCLNATKHRHLNWCNTNKKLSWCWQTRETRLEVSQGHQT